MKANKMQIILRFIGFTIKLSAMYLEVVSNWYHSIKTLLTLFLKFKTFLKRIQFRSSLHRTIKLSKLFKQLLMNYCNKLVMRGVARGGERGIFHQQHIARQINNVDKVHCYILSNGLDYHYVCLCIHISHISITIQKSIRDIFSQ